MKKDERVKKLEAQISFFREEALLLATKLDSYKSENQLLKQKCKDLQEENKFLVQILASQRNKCALAEKALSQTNQNCQRLITIVKDNHRQNSANKQLL